MHEYIELAKKYASVTWVNGFEFYNYELIAYSEAPRAKDKEEIARNLAKQQSLTEAALLAGELAVKRADRTEQELAATQRVVVQMREALLTCISVDIGHPSRLPQQMFNEPAVKEAVALQASTAALDELRANALEDEANLAMESVGGGDARDNEHNKALKWYADTLKRRAAELRAAEKVN